MRKTASDNFISQQTKTASTQAANTKMTTLDDSYDFEKNQTGDKPPTAGCKTARESGGPSEPFRLPLQTPTFSRGMESKPFVAIACSKDRKNHSKQSLKFAENDHGSQTKRSKINLPQKSKNDTKAAKDQGEYGEYSDNSTDNPRRNKAERLSLQRDNKNLMAQFLGSKKKSHATLATLKDRQKTPPKATSIEQKISSNRLIPKNKDLDIQLASVIRQTKNVYYPPRSKSKKFQALRCRRIDNQIGQKDASASIFYNESLLDGPLKTGRREQLKNVYAEISARRKGGRPKLKESVKVKGEKSNWPENASEKSNSSTKNQRRNNTVNQQNKTFNVGNFRAQSRGGRIALPKEGPEALFKQRKEIELAIERPLLEESELEDTLEGRKKAKEINQGECVLTEQEPKRKGSGVVAVGVVDDKGKGKGVNNNDREGAQKTSGHPFGLRGLGKVLGYKFQNSLKGKRPIPKQKQEAIDNDRQKAVKESNKNKEPDRKAVSNTSMFSPANRNSVKPRFEIHRASDSDCRGKSSASMEFTSSLLKNLETSSFTNWESQMRAFSATDEQCKSVKLSIQKQFLKIEKEGSGEFKTLSSYYKILGKIVESTFSSVYHAVQIVTGCPVALKLIPKESLIRNIKLHQEIFILKKIRNRRFMMRLLEVFEDATNIYLILEYHANGDMITYLNDRALLPESELAPMFRKVVLAVRTLHELNIIHRDIKMDNILLDKNGQPVLSDFGISSLVQPDTLIKDTGGTPAYLAPEVINAAGGVCFKTDVWGLGVLLYTLLYGVLPFKGNDFQELYKNILSESFEFPQKETSKDVKDLITKMLKVSLKVRLDIDGVLSHPWLQQHENDVSESKLSLSELPKLPQRTKDQYVRFLNDAGFPIDHLFESLSNNKINHCTACFDNLRCNFD